MRTENMAAMPAGLLLARSQASFRSRIAHLALLLCASGASVVVGSLLATEDGLPLRTILALAALLLVNLSWVAYAAWVLKARRTMLLNHRVVAGRIAVAAATAFTAGAAILAATMQTSAGYLATGLGFVLLVLATALLMRAKRDFRALQMRRRELEARLAEIVR